MKRIILSVMLAAFAVAVQAGDDKACTDKEKSGCCMKAKSADQAKAGCCSMDKQAKTTGSQAAGNTCKAGATKVALMSPKAAAEAGK